MAKDIRNVQIWWNFSWWYGAWKNIANHSGVKDRAKITILFQISKSLKEGLGFIMKIAAYARVSTEKESQVESFEKQKEFYNLNAWI